ncbi:MAG: stage V sporulation protein D, partial [Firmicutes bacterium]|nr:stage V sporulation protein D [Bacillota bacterium]
MLLFICLLCLRLGYIQIVKGEEYSKMAIAQQTRDELIVAKRGDIVDRNGEQLAISSSCYTLWARPAKVLEAESDAEKKVKLQETATSLSAILGVPEEEIKETLTSDKTLIKVAKYLGRDKVDTIKAQKIAGLEFSEESKRSYPLGNFAAHVLGAVTDDNNGMAGIELKYNQYLSGVSGRWIKNTDVGGNDLSYGVDDYYAAEDGLTVVMTLDTVIQHYVEKAIKTTQQNTSADRVMCIVMDPKTGDVLAMAMTPDYDPNNPRVPLDEEEAAYLETLPQEEKVDYWNKMWRNPMISDTYEPGSTFKLLTTSIALEEEVTNPKENFYCSGSYKVADVTLHCWRRGNPYGAETLTEAVGNSCNPIFIQLAQRVGEDKYYDYLERYGLYEKTGIDFPGEGMAILQNKKTAGPVGLATMSYGQGIAVTPIQLITAVCTIGNGGKLLQPRMVKALKDKDGNTVKEFET